MRETRLPSVGRNRRGAQPADGNRRERAKKRLSYIAMEVIFEIRDAEEGGYYARALGHSIFTEADTWDELRKNVLEAVSLHFEGDANRPRIVQLHYVKDELIPLEAA